MLLVANAVQPAMTGPDTSLAGGLIIIAALMAVNFAVARLDRVPFFRRILESEPALIIKDGQYLVDRMRREGIDQQEVDTAIREHGLDSVSKVQLGVLEPDGSISIVAQDVEVTRTRRRIKWRRRI